MAINLNTTSFPSLFSSGSGSSTTSNTQNTSPTQSLVEALDSVDDSSDSSDSVDLSQAAQTLLGTGGSSSSTASFTLTDAQQEKIKAILEKYKDSPFTEATFDQIQSDLSAAGLGADQLMAQDQTSSFDATDSLISALNGNYNTSSASSLLSNEQNKASNYLQSIISEWQSLSSGASSSASSSSDSSS